MTESFDTHKAFLDLTESDCFPTDQAERLVALINGAVVGNVATKTDLENLEKVLKSDMSNLKQELKSDMSNLEQALKSDMSNLEQTLKLEMKTLKKEFEGQVNSYKNETKLWVISAIAIAIGLIKALDYLLPGGISP